MTLCIAALCEGGRTLVMAADSMASLGFVCAELDIHKVRRIHRNWWVMIAGDDIVPVFDILEWTKKQLHEESEHTYEEVSGALLVNYQRKRLTLAEQAVLLPRGISLSEFRNNGVNLLPRETFARLDNAVQNFEFPLKLLLGGFDREGNGYIASVHEPGYLERHDIPGFHAIGNGQYGALYMMYYRKMSVSMSLLDCLYYTYEANRYGYEAGGIGNKTEIYILRHNSEIQLLNEAAVESLDEIWSEVKPKEPERLDRVSPFLEEMEKQETSIDVDVSIEN